MDTLLIQVTDKNAYNLLKDLEKLNIIKVLKNNPASQEKLSDRFAGKLSPEAAEKLQEHIKKSREEWDM